MVPSSYLMPFTRLEAKELFWGGQTPLSQNWEDTLSKSAPRFRHRTAKIGIHILSCLHALLLAEGENSFEIQRIPGRILLQSLLQWSCNHENV